MQLFINSAYEITNFCFRPGSSFQQIIDVSECWYRFTARLVYILKNIKIKHKKMEKITNIYDTLCTSRKKIILIQQFGQNKNY